MPKPIFNLEKEIILPVRTSGRSYLTSSSRRENNHDRVWIAQQFPDYPRSTPSHHWKKHRKLRFFFDYISYSIDVVLCVCRNTYQYDFIYLSRMEDKLLERSQLQKIKEKRKMWFLIVTGFLLYFEGKKMMYVPVVKESVIWFFSY